MRGAGGTSDSGWTIVLTPRDVVEFSGGIETTRAVLESVCRMRQRVSAIKRDSSRVLKKAVFGGGQVPDEVSGGRCGRWSESVTACGVPEHP